jgi:hypothetical protein
VAAVPVVIVVVVVLTLVINFIDSKHFTELFKISQNYFLCNKMDELIAIGQ